MSKTYDIWEEITISKPYKNRTVHYYLKSFDGSSLLAAVGTEKNEGHMIYVISKEYLEVFGSNPTINAHTKWTARRDLVKCLISLLHKDEQPPTILKQKGSGSESSDVQKEEELPQEDPLNRVPKKPRTSLALQIQDSGCSDAINLVLPNEIAATEPTTLKLNTDQPEPTGVQIFKPNPIKQAAFQVGNHIEILSQDSGLRGCWLRAKILKVFKSRFKVEYIDVDDVERSGKLQEWVSTRDAVPDKLYMRRSGRQTIRPFPPDKESRRTLEVGTPIDAWWCDGWWEGIIVTAVALGTSENYHVFLPGERKFLTFHRADLRVSRDWVNNVWLAAKRRNLVSVISFSLNQRVK